MMGETIIDFTKHSWFLHHLADNPAQVVGTAAGSMITECRMPCAQQAMFDANFVHRKS
jgi:hypothetical protein